jgi:hypothetical protein
MSKSNPKKVVTTTSNTTTRAKVESPTSRKSSSILGSKEELIFSKTNYKWMGIGLGLILLGMLLMAGGAMPNADTWDPNIIYSARRTVLAPIFILSGLVVQIYAIFK